MVPSTTTLSLLPYHVVPTTTPHGTFNHTPWYPLSHHTVLFTTPHGTLYHTLGPFYPNTLTHQVVPYPHGPFYHIICTLYSHLHSSTPRCPFFHTLWFLLYPTWSLLPHHRFLIPKLLVPSVLQYVATPFTLQYFVFLPQWRRHEKFNT